MARPDDDRLDAMLAALTDPGEDAAFRARVLARLDGGTRTTWSPRQLAPAALVVVGMSAVAVGIWLGAWPGGRGLAPTPAAQLATAMPAAAPAMERDEGAALPVTDPAPPVVDHATSRPSRAQGGATSAVARTRATSRLSRAGAALPQRPDEDAAWLYGMQPVRIKAVAVSPVTLPGIAEDPSLSRITPPDPVRVDPIDIEEIAPRR